MSETLTIPQIESRMGIPANTLYYWIRSGLKAEKVGRDYQINLDDLKHFMDERVEIGTTYKLKDAPKKND